MSLLFDYMCMRLPFIPWSIAGVPSSQALSSFLDTAPPSVLVPVVLDALAVWIQKQNNKLCGGKKIGIRVWRQNISKKKVIYSTMFIVLCYGYMYDSLNTRISGPAWDLGM